MVILVEQPYTYKLGKNIILQEYFPLEEMWDQCWDG